MVAILYSDRHDERWLPLMQELERQNITDYTIFSPVIEGATSIMHSISLSHKNIVRYAKEHELLQITIFEDDIMFPSINAWRTYLEKWPEDFDIYLGGCYNFKIREDGTLFRFTATHCYTVHNRFYDRFISAPEDRHIDSALDGLGVYRLCYPIIAIQRPGYSANNYGFADHNQMLKPEDVYGDLYAHLKP